MSEPTPAQPCPQCAQMGELEYSEGHYGAMKIPPTDSWILAFWRCSACKHLWTEFMSLEPSVSKKDWASWITNLNKSIWHESTGQYFANMSGTHHSYTRREVARRVKETEWAQLQGVIESEKLFCEMTNANMGFGFGMRVYKSPEYPGLPPEPLLYVTTEHFEDRNKTRPDGYDREWFRFKKLVYAPENVAALVFHGLGKPKDKTYYDY